MARYAFTFDLDTTAMQDNGLTPSERTQIYQTEIPYALVQCGFVRHPQGSLYLTELQGDPIQSIVLLRSTLQQYAPNFGRYVRSAHLYSVETWSNVTAILQAPGVGTDDQAIRSHDVLSGAVSVTMGAHTECYPVVV